MVAASELPAATVAAASTSVPVAPTPTTVMHPAANAATSSGVAGSLTVIAVWLLGFMHVAVPSDVETAFGVLFTGLIAYWLHCRSQPRPQPGVSP